MRRPEQLRAIRDKSEWHGNKRLFGIGSAWSAASSCRLGSCRPVGTKSSEASGFVRQDRSSRGRRRGLAALPKNPQPRQLFEADSVLIPVPFGTSPSRNRHLTVPQPCRRKPLWSAAPVGNASAWGPKGVSRSLPMADGKRGQAPPGMGTHGRWLLHRVLQDAWRRIRGADGVSRPRRRT